MIKRLSSDPFIKARLRLTAWYVLTAIVMILAFDLLIVRAEQTSYLRVKRVGLGAEFSSPSLIEFEEQFGQFSQGFKQRLALFSGVMVALSTVVGYFLSGKALQPIQHMFEKQQAFAADVSHELRTPLTSIVLSIDHFKLTQSVRHKPTLELLKSIQEEAARMKHIAQGLVLVVRHDTRSTHPLKKVSLLKISQRAQKHMLPIALTKNQTIALEVAEKELYVMGNEEELLQVVLILLDNAIKYSPQNAQTTISFKQTKAGTHLIVTDQGIGLASGELKNIFKRFYRGKKANDQTTAGSGLGLSIAHEILLRHNGSISVARLKQGTRFTLAFPNLG